MQPTDFCHYIDTKGTAHNAQVVLSRPNKVEKDGVVIHDEPILSISYTDPATNRPVVLHDIVHISHPSKQETNPALPTIHLHCWKRLDEVHNAPAEDHPIFDHPHERPKTDHLGRTVPKARPKHEAMIAAHQAGLTDEQRAEIAEGERKQKELSDEHLRSDPAFRLPQNQAVGATVQTGQKPVAEPVIQKAEEHHPGNPNTVHFDFECASCGKAVKRVASHQGGEQFEAEPQHDGKWVKHVCNPEDIKDHHAKVNAPKEVPQQELSPSEKLAAGTIPSIPQEAFEGAEQLKKAAETLTGVEGGVIAQLEKDANADHATEAQSQQGDEQQG